MARFLFLSHLDFNLFRFRLPIMKALVERGHEVVAASPGGPYAARLPSHGIAHESFEIDRRGLNLASELKVVFALRSLLRKVRPTLLHTFMHKPNIYGSLAARGLPDLKVVNSVTGLGSVYDGSRATLSRVVNGLYRVALRPSAAVVFQNDDNRDYFTSRRLVEARKVVLIRGEGVDTKEFLPVDRGNRPVVRVCMVARLIRDKGVEEYVEAARQVRATHGDQVRFCLVGDPDPGNQGSMAATWLEKVRAVGDVELLGVRDDIARILAESDIYCLPSYGEGLPVSVLEALASGLPVVTTDVSGCRDTVREGTNGFLVPPRDAVALANAIRRLAEDPGLRGRFGAAGRVEAETRFSVDVIVGQLIELYERVLRVRI
jgi:N,N'-diacetylbacillosaminyl-diphospho-undecaprenol alpha-1,3-N-acetylgalactosaminyltransferase